MSLVIAVQMDPIESINPRTDSTLLLMLEAQQRGYTLFYYTPNDIAWDCGQVFATVYPITVQENSQEYYTLGQARRLPLAETSVVLMRQDPPFNMHYIAACHLLERLPPGTRVVNNPQAVRDRPEKLFPLDFARFMPPTLITAHADDIRAFHQAQKEIVLKPLFGHGGRAVFRIGRDGQNIEPLLEMLLPPHAEPLVAQAFLPEVSTGDRRVILIDGEVVGTFGRIPAEGDIRANMRVGGTPASAELSPRQREICEAVGPVLREQGIVLAGLDLIGDWLTEINITSPTGLRALKKLYGLQPETMFWDAVEQSL